MESASVSWISTPHNLIILIWYFIFVWIRSRCTWRAHTHKHTVDSQIYAHEMHKAIRNTERWCIVSHTIDGYSPICTYWHVNAAAAGCCDLFEFDWYTKYPTQKGANESEWEQWREKDATTPRMCGVFTYTHACTMHLVCGNVVRCVYAWWACRIGDYWIPFVE